MLAALKPLATPFTAYTRWLHTQWPAGKPDKLPVVSDDGTTNVPGLFVVGDLSGIPLLKLSINGGVRVVRRIAEDLKAGSADADTLDIAIIGGGTAGFAAAKEARKLGLRYCVFEAAEPFSTIVNFPKRKPIYKYPTEMTLEGGIDFTPRSDIKEGLIDELREQTLDEGLRWVRGRVSHVQRKGGGFDVVLAGPAERPEGVSLDGVGFVTGGERVRAKRVIVAIGRSGNYRKLGVPGEDLDKVYNRLHDPADFCGQDVLVVGGGDSAMETAIAIAECGGHVTLSYRKPEFNRPKPENIEKITALANNPDARADVEEATDPRQSASMGDAAKRAETRGKLTLMMSSSVTAIREDAVDVKDEHGQSQTLKNESVFAMIGREPPLDFFRRSGVNVLGDRSVWWWVSLALFFTFCVWVYTWKSHYADEFAGFNGLALPDWLHFDPATAIHRLQATLGQWASDPANPVGVLLNSMQGRSFYYTLVYSMLIVIFGVRRIRRRRTPYVTWQTLTLMVIQVVPLFLLPEFVLPWLNGLGFFDHTATGRWLEATLFPGESWWRAYGLILAWPLMAWNWFTAEPIWGWLILGSLQTFVLIPGMIYFWGKGAYCGWICSCGAMAETLGDTHRHKMPHGPFWNRLNMAGQAILLFAVGLMGVRILGWMGVAWADDLFNWLATDAPLISYNWLVDLLLAGAVGYGVYFWLSGRFWCRLFCPLAALMHIYHRFSRFAILSDKKKCISCNVCTSVCHQGIDVMSFANKGKPMIDPECVRCSACVQMCPTGVLTFGQYDRKTGEPISIDPAWLAASPVNIREGQITINGKPFHRNPG